VLSNWRELDAGTLRNGGAVGNDDNNEKSPDIMVHDDNDNLSMTFLG